MKEHNIKNPKRKGFYYGDGKIEFPKPLPSVTEILKVLDKGGLMFWYAKLAVETALDNPSLSLKDIMSATQLKSREGATRGTGVHNLVPKVIKGEEYEPYPEQYKPYITGLLKFIKEMKPKIVMHDQIVYSQKYEYAGSLDLVLEINGSKFLVDVKTGNTYPEHGLQLASYAQCLEENFGLKVDGKAILLLRGDDVYSFIQMNEPLEIFLACKQIYDWRRGFNNGN